VITETDNEAPSLAALARKTLATGLGALRNRGELLVVEWQEEKGRIIQILLLAIGALFLAMLGVVLLTGTVLLLVPDQYRIYVAAGFAVLYLAGAAIAAFALKTALKRVPFAESLDQIRKDRELMEAFR
jgi:uncharacterized membrane protein YqjE